MTPEADREKATAAVASLYAAGDDCDVLSEAIEGEEEFKMCECTMLTLLCWGLGLQILH
jgi:hypothetical protein